MSIGEAGSITTNSPTINQPITVTLGEPLTDPVFALSATNNGGNQFVLRVTDQTLDANGNTTAFTFIIEEWEYLDGAHPVTETINWLAIEEGVHTLPDGRIIEAGTVLADNTNSSVTLAGEFSTPPVVLTSVMSENDTTTVDSDPLNITSTGFNVRLQEEEEQDGVHANETVGWIAIQPGGDATSGTANAFNGVNQNTDTLGLGTTFTNSIVLAETQTINGGDTATVVIDGQTNSTVGVFIEEEQSQDAEVNHVNETVGIVAFEDGLIPCFASGTHLETPSGLRKVETLRVGDLVSTADHGPQHIRWIGTRRLVKEDLDQSPNFRPIRILAGALGMGLPRRDLFVSRQHRMLVSSKIAFRMFGVQDVLVSALKLTTLPGIFIDETVDALEYHHLMFDNHEVVFAEGAPSESLFAGREVLNALTKDGLSEIYALFPELAEHEQPPTPARHIPSAKLQKRLIDRHQKNDKSLLI